MPDLDALNHASVDQAKSLLADCCGSRRWVDAMVVARPFSSAQALTARADSVWRTLDRDDVLEAIGHHPRIGDTRGASAAEASEQARAIRADGDIKDAIARGNQQYEARFGHIYLVCATGKSGTELLSILQSRLTNDAETELRVAAEEQRKITELRLRRLVGAR